MRLHWFAPQTNSAGRSSLVRRALRRLGPTWAASPARRLAQTACLALFAWLFCYVCWPYAAQPARSWRGWVPVEVDAETGCCTVTNEAGPHDAPLDGRTLYAVDESAATTIPLAAFRVEAVDGATLRLRPEVQLDAAAVERLSASFGPWTLRETAPGQWPSHYADDLAAKRKLPVDLFLLLDPLAAVSAAIAARSWIAALLAAGAILAVSLVIPRGFCAYACPLGALIDLFDWAIGRRLRWFHLHHDGWWRNLKYGLLAATLAAAALGILLSGFVAAIPVVTRGLAFLVAPLELGLLRGWHQVPPISAGQIVSIGLFAAVFALGFMRPRFWCRCVCPTGAVFSLGNLLRFHQRQVRDECVACGRCLQHCPFDAIQPADYSTRTADCAFCQTCGGVCPTGAVEFVPRTRRPVHAAKNTVPQRRRFLASAASILGGIGGGLALGGAMKVCGGAKPDVLRPPGSVSEDLFLQLCVRCGQCFPVCPNNVLQPLGLSQGVERLWTPYAATAWAGCEPSCNRCGQVCPTGAIRPLLLEQKRLFRMGLAVVNLKTCLPHAQREACQLCADDCAKAGYNAIEFLRVGTQADPFGQPIEDAGFLAPVVVADKCVGCGLCQTRCHMVNVRQKGLLAESAVIVRAGVKADAIRSAPPAGSPSDAYLPDSLR